MRHAAKIFPHVNDLHQWQGWSPWARMDPTAQTTFDGPAAGTGAAMAWVGTRTGTGKMTIIDSRPAELVVFKLEFLIPMVAANTAEFTFTPQGGQTLVTWSMFGKANFMSKAMGLLMSCDKMVGGQFAQGLADLKTVAEAQE